MTSPEHGGFADDAGRYRLEQLIATGGMGEVWRALDTSLGREVAVKLLKREYAGDPVFRSRFEAEARHAAGLHHPGIAAVFDVGESVDSPDGARRPYLVMELVEGQPLSALLRPEEPLDPEAVRDLLAQAGDALAVAHRAGIVHRDVKPANLMVTPQRTIKVTDFGIARATAGMAITGTGAVMGTPQYLSPEQARGDQATPASDVYGLGVVAYECLAGHRPFDRETPVATALAHLNDPVPALPDSVPADLAAVVMRALAKRPADRYPDGGGFADALRGATADAATAVVAAPLPPTGPATGPVTEVLPPTAAVPAAAEEAGTAREPEQEPRRSTPWLIAAVVAAVLLLGLLGWWLLGSDGEEAPPAQTTPTPTATATRPDTPRATPTPTTSAAPETFDLELSRYVGRDVDAVLDELRGLGLDPRSNRIANPGGERADTVAEISPTRNLREGDRVDVAYYGEPPAPSPTAEPTTEEPTDTPSDTASPTTETSSPGVVETSPEAREETP